MSDPIDRQAAIGVNDVRKIVEKYLDADDCNGSDVAMDILSDIRELPPAQPENDWIPVTKKAHPDKEGEYLVTDDAGGMATVDEDGFMFLDDGTPCWRYSQNVTAWRELPEPYKERREE